MRLPIGSLTTNLTVMFTIPGRCPGLCSVPFQGGDLNTPRGPPLQGGESVWISLARCGGDGAG